MFQCKCSDKPTSDTVSNCILLYHTYLTGNRELPRVLTMYDIDMPLPAAHGSIRNMFTQYAGIRDERVVDVLVEKVRTAILSHIFMLS